MLNLSRYGTAIVEWRVLSGPAILRISVLLLIAGVLAALVQFLLPADAPTTVAEPPVLERQAESATPADQPAPASPAPAAKAPERAPVRKAGPPASPARMPADALAFPPADAPPADPPPADTPPATAPPIPTAPVPAAPSPRGEAEITKAETDAGPRALALVDLNTASVADLNRLQGGGTIGRAIVSKRPYASIDQLLTKRVLSRAVYDRIRAQVTVR